MKSVLSIVCLLSTLIAHASMDIHPSYLNFGTIEINDGDSLSVYLTNEGDRPMVIEEISFFGPFEFFIDNYCPDTLTPGEECEVQVSVRCQEFVILEGAIEIEVQEHWPETVFVEAECSNF